MLDFIAEYGPIILTGLSTLGTAVGVIYSIGRSFKIGSKLNKTIEETNDKIQITQEGIIEAFKQVKIPSEWKISISSQVDKKLNDFTETFMKQYQENEAEKYLMVFLCLKILANTAAANKLSEEDKAKLKSILDEVDEANKTIDVTEDTTV